MGKTAKTAGPPGQKLKMIKKMRTYYLLLLPFLAFIVIFKYVPMYGITLAFKDFRILDGLMGIPWAGFKYFIHLF